MKPLEIELELQKATKVTPAGDDEPRQDYLCRLVKASEDLATNKWEALSEPAQVWANAGIPKLTKKGELADEKDPIDDFVKPKADKADKKGKKAKAVEPTENEEPGSDDSGDPTDDADEDDDKKGDDGDSDDPVDDDDDKKDGSDSEEEADLADSKKKSTAKGKTKSKGAEKKAAAEPKAAAKKEKPAKVAKVAKVAEPKKERAGVKTAIKQVVLKNPKIKFQDLLETLKDNKLKVSDSTVRAISIEFRHTLNFLADKKLIDDKYRS